MTPDQLVFHEHFALLYAVLNYVLPLNNGHDFTNEDMMEMGPHLDTLLSRSADGSILLDQFFREVVELVEKKGAEVRERKFWGELYSELGIPAPMFDGSEMDTLFA